MIAQYKDMLVFVGHRYLSHQTGSMILYDVFSLTRVPILVARSVKDNELTWLQ